jgi:4-carboxymuconolactone decarboxylase
VSKKSLVNTLVDQRALHTPKRRLAMGSWATTASVGVVAIYGAYLLTIPSQFIHQSSTFWENTSRDLVPRYTGPPVEQLTRQQKKIRHGILKSRPRTGLSGPFGPWLAVPDIAQPAQALGRACRYGTSLTFAESELVILLTGAKTRSHADFDIHVGEALKAGWSRELVDAIPRDDDFSVAAVQRKLWPFLTTDRDRAIATFTAELLDTYNVSEETYAATKKALDGKDSVLVELTSIVGYYTYVAYTLNVFRIPSV